MSGGQGVGIGSNSVSISWLRRGLSDGDDAEDDDTISWAIFECTSKDRNWKRREEKRVAGLGVSGVEGENGGCAEKCLVGEVVGQDGVRVSKAKLKASDSHESH
ncbi:hypothetical protein ACE6H2_002707 [Prunus campanulata]